MSINEIKRLLLAFPVLPNNPEHRHGGGRPPPRDSTAVPGRGQGRAHGRRCRPRQLLRENALEAPGLLPFAQSRFARG